LIKALPTCFGFVAGVALVEPVASSASEMSTGEIVFFAVVLCVLTVCVLLVDRWFLSDEHEYTREVTRDDDDDADKGTKL
jgi:hypothetical protein